MANFKIIIKKESFLELTVTAKNKLDACLLAENKSKNREGWSNEIYTILNVTPL